MNYYTLWGTAVTKEASSGRNYTSLFLILGAIFVVICATYYFAVIRPYYKEKKKADEIKRLDSLLKQGQITEAEFKEKRREIIARR